jgi:hypothetical protein
MRRIQVAFLTLSVLFCLVGFVEADADGGVWERLSGPGPWLGIFGSLRADLGDFKFSAGHSVLAEEDEEEWWVVLTASWAFTLGNKLDYPPDFEGSKRVYWFMFEPMLERSWDKGSRRIFLGVGYGFNYFYGNFENFWRGSLNPQGGIGFIRGSDKKLKSIDLVFAPKWFPKAFSPEDFGAKPEPQDGGEWVLGGFVRFNFWN